MIFLLWTTVPVEILGDLIQINTQNTYFWLTETESERGRSHATNVPEGFEWKDTLS